MGGKKIIPNNNTNLFETEIRILDNYKSPDSCFLLYRTWVYNKSNDNEFSKKCKTLYYNIKRTIYDKKKELLINTNFTEDFLITDVDIGYNNYNGSDKLHLQVEITIYQKPNKLGYKSKKCKLVQELNLINERILSLECFKPNDFLTFNKKNSHRKINRENI